ncbi:MAG: hypothetical protein RLZZ552_491 [Verrucomicrobiota bacterium]
MLYTCKKIPGIVRQLARSATSSDWQNVVNTLAAELQEKGVPLPDAQAEAQDHRADFLRELDDYNTREVLNGSIPAFDHDSTNYFRVLVALPAGQLETMNNLPPQGFERLCAELVGRICKESRHTGRAGDGGIDFSGHGMRLHATGAYLCGSAAPSLLGQAKRYAACVREQEIREFIGSVIVQRAKVDIATMAPIVSAFWTNHYLDKKAEALCRRMGIWYMDGRNLCLMARDLGVDIATFT